MSIEKRPLRVARAAGFSVHVFTASGGAVAVLALYAAIERNFSACFAWLGLALFIDGIDGTLARAARVQVTAASIDGAVLDLVIDFLTYVLVPVVALWRSDLMPTEASFWIGLVVTIASALYFADTRMKTDDLWFRGFPATWNILALYLFVLRPPWVVSAAVLLGAAGLMFAPVAFVHPLRVVRLRAPTIAVTMAWFGFATLAIVDDRQRGEAEPGHGHGDRRRAEPHHPKRVDEGDRREHEPRRAKQNRGADDPGRTQDEEVKRQNIPRGRKAAKPEVVGLHPRVGEIERRRSEEHEADPERGLGRHQVRAPERHDRHEHIGEKVDHQIEDDAVDGRR